MFQTFALLPWLTVAQNVELGLEAQGIPSEERARRALEAIDLIGLDGFESAFPKELSGGMRQRVGFARALVVEPDLLLMDEPFSALDVLTAENLRTELLELWHGRDDGRGIVSAEDPHPASERLGQPRPKPSNVIFHACAVKIAKIAAASRPIWLCGNSPMNTVTVIVKKPSTGTDWRMSRIGISTLSARRLRAAA